MVTVSTGELLTACGLPRHLAAHVVIAAKPSSANVPGTASAPALPDPSARRLPIKAKPYALLQVPLCGSLDVALRLGAVPGHEPSGADRTDPVAWTRHLDYSVYSSRLILTWTPVKHSFTLRLPLPARYTLVSHLAGYGTVHRPSGS